MLDHDSSTSLRKLWLAPLLLLATASACQRQLPIVDDGPYGPQAGGAAAAGRGSMANASNAAGAMAGSSNAAGGKAVADSAVCTDHGPAQLIRPNRQGAAVLDILPNRDGLIFSESRANTQNVIFAVAVTNEVLYSLSADGKQEQVLYAPDPPIGLRNLYLLGDTLFFTTYDPATRPALYSLALSGGAPQLIYRFDLESESPGIVGADDQYVYVYQSFNPFSARISRSDGTRVDLPFGLNTGVGVALYQNTLWYMVNQSTTARPAGLYQLDARVPMPAEVRIGERTCGLLDDWRLNSDFVFCAAARSINRFDLRAAATSEQTRVYTAPKSGEDGNVLFSRPDGDFVYFRAAFDVNQTQHPIRRVNLRTSAVDAISCARKQTDSIVGTATHVYWIEHRHADDTSQDGIYRVAKP
jgi:hypothetical protein